MMVTVNNKKKQLPRIHGWVHRRCEPVAWGRYSILIPFTLNNSQKAATTRFQKL